MAAMPRLSLPGALSVSGGPGSASDHAFLRKTGAQFAGRRFSGEDNPGRQVKNAAGSVLILAEMVPEDFTVADVSGNTEAPIPLHITASRYEPDDDLFALRGVPDEGSLSGGAHNNEAWVVSRKDVGSLTLTLPKDFSGAFEIFVTRSRTVLHPQQTLSFMVKAAGKAPNVSAETKPPPPPPDASKAGQPRTQTPNEKLVFDRASAQFAKGDVAGARAMFEFLATKGDPAAALALGETYDPLVLSKLFIKGVAGDQAKALEWYRKAEEWGNPGARSHISALSGK